MRGNTNAAGVYPPSRISGPLSEIRASHVCSRWRTIALATPLLWNHLFLVNWSALIRVETYLERSEGCPLNLWVDLLSGTAKQRKLERFRHVVLPLLVPHLHRIRRLFLMTQDDHTLQDLSAAFLQTPTASLMQTIRAGAWNPWSDYIESRAAPQLMSDWTPTVFVTGPTPLPSSVYLDQCSMRYLRPPLDLVTHLRLVWAPMNHQANAEPPFEISILSYIIALPCLQTLELSTWLFNFDSLNEVPQRLNAIKASELRHFRSDGTFVALYFLCNVFAPLLESATFYELDPCQYKTKFVVETPQFPSLHTLMIAYPICSPIIVNGHPRPLALLQNILSVCQSIQHLAFDLKSCDSPFLFRLSQVICGNPPLLSNVTELSFFEATPDAKATAAQESVRRLVDAFPRLMTLRVEELRKERLNPQDWRGRDITISTADESFPAQHVHQSVPWPLPRATHRWETPAGATSGRGRGKYGRKQVLKTDVHWEYDVRNSNDWRAFYLLSLQHCP